MSNFSVAVLSLLGLSLVSSFRCSFDKSCCDCKSLTFPSFINNGKFPPDMFSFQIQNIRLGGTHPVENVVSDDYIIERISINLILCRP